MDYVAIRRDMIDMGYLNRDSSGGFYCVNASKEDKQSIDTGKFKLIFKGNDLKEIELPNK